MSLRRRIQTDVPESRRIQTDIPETEVPDGCPRDGGFRRMSPRRRFQADVPETEGRDGYP